MTISKDTQALLSLMKETTGKDLFCEDDSALIIEVSASHNNGHLFFNELLFNASALSKLSHTLQKAQAQEGVELIQKEFQAYLAKFIANLNSLLGYLDEKDRTKFTNTFLEKTKDSVVNLINLSYDLALIKHLQKK